jgi:hypothetical protein
MNVLLNSLSPTKGHLSSFCGLDVGVAGQVPTGYISILVRVKSNIGSNPILHTCVYGLSCGIPFRLVGPTGHTLPMRAPATHAYSSTSAPTTLLCPCLPESSSGCGILPAPPSFNPCRCDKPSSDVAHGEPPRCRWRQTHHGRITLAEQEAHLAPCHCMSLTVWLMWLLRWSRSGSWINSCLFVALHANPNGCGS